MGFVYTETPSKTGRQLAYQCSSCMRIEIVNRDNLFAEHFEFDNWLDYYEYDCYHCGQKELQFCHHTELQRLMELGAHCLYNEDPADDELASEYYRQYGFPAPRGQLSKRDEAVAQYWANRMDDVTNIPEFLQELNLGDYDSP